MRSGSPRRINAPASIEPLALALLSRRHQQEKNLERKNRSTDIDDLILTTIDRPYCGHVATQWHANEFLTEQLSLYQSCYLEFWGQPFCHSFAHLANRSISTVWICCVTCSEGWLASMRTIRSGNVFARSVKPCCTR